MQVCLYSAVRSTLATFLLKICQFLPMMTNTINNNHNFYEQEKHLHLQNFAYKHAGKTK